MDETKIQLLEDYEVYEQIFREGGRYDAEVVIGEGDEAVTAREYLPFSIKEYVSTRDAMWMFPRVVANVMVEAAEPLLLVTPLLNTVRLNTAVRSIDYQAVGALQAAEVGETQEYPEQNLAWAGGAKTAKVTKKGLKVPISDEMVEDSLFDLMGMYLRAAGKAMARFKEQIAIARFFEAAKTVKENDSASAAFNPLKGINAAGAPNGALDALDLLEVWGQMVAAGRTPTDIIIHPLAWTMWASDPIIRNLGWYSNGPGVTGNATRFADNAPIAGKGATAANATMAAFLQRTAPMGLNVICSPYVAYDSATNTTDILVIDRNDVGALTVRDDLSVEQFDVPERDIVAMKIKERYDITIFPTDGFNICRLGNVVVERNYGRDVDFTHSVAADFADFTGV